MSDPIGSSLSELKERAKRCEAHGGLPQVRLRFVEPLKGEVIFTCYGETDIPVRGGTIEIPESVVEKLRRQDARSGKKLMKALNIKTSEQKRKEEKRKRKKKERELKSVKEELKKLKETMGEEERLEEQVAGKQKG